MVVTTRPIDSLVFRCVLVEVPQVQDEMIQDSLTKRTRTDERGVIGPDDEGTARLVKELVVIGKDRKRLESNRDEVLDFFV